MDTTPNVIMETPTPQTPPKSTPKNKSNGGLVALCIFLTLIAVGLLVYLANDKGYINIPFLSKLNTNTDTNTQTQEEIGKTTDVSKDVKFTGTVITATLPEGWSMKEYFNGDGSDYLVEGTTYTGLTGIKIFNTSNAEVFHLAAVNGIGFEGCSEYYAFEDDSPAYRSEMQNMVDEIGDTMHVNDFSGTPYFEFTWLGRSTRRIANKLYLDETEGNNYFEASCFNVLVTLKGLSFSGNDGNKYEAYFYGYSTSVTNTELEQIDKILESMELVK